MCRAEQLLGSGTQGHQATRADGPIGECAGIQRLCGRRNAWRQCAGLYLARLETAAASPRRCERPVQAHRDCPHQMRGSLRIERCHRFELRCRRLHGNLHT
eukprot:6407516-Prymnesium_polylepis.1